MKIIIVICLLLATNGWTQNETPVPVQVNVSFPDKEAEFPGGAGALQTYLRTNLVYPEDARAQKIEGKVYVSFVIEKDGSVSEIKVEKGLCESCDREALRLIGTMPNWIPGEAEGEKVRTRCRLPVLFELD